ncbi:hypothetical protein ILYODFUR_038809 [Ilyodon furcidens]|uniref:Uncharacterized protein n=1 Tax=Ilyodon furcidens TaxID=33524 RepID=A0ABV0UDX1_9TELE
MSLPLGVAKLRNRIQTSFTSRVYSFLFFYYSRKNKTKTSNTKGHMIRGSWSRDLQGSLSLCASMARCIFSTIHRGTLNGFSSSILTSGQSLRNIHTHYHGNHILTVPHS